MSTENGSGDRLQKILARAGIASRRKAEELIEEGRVTINGQVATLGDRADLERDAVKVDGKRVQPPPSQHKYLLLNKPRAVMSTVADPEGRPTVIELVPPALRKALVPVGRLDFLTEGLLLLTDDGDLAQRIAHPRYGCVKTYEAKVRGEPSERELAKLRGGIVLEGRKTAPAVIERHLAGGARRSRTARKGESAGVNTWWRVQLREGRTRQIREMFQRVGHPVVRLRRVAIGPLSDSALPLGGVRELTEAEVEALRKSTLGQRKTAAGKGAKRASGGGKKAPGGGKPLSGGGKKAPGGGKPSSSGKGPRSGGKGPGGGGKRPSGGGAGGGRKGASGRGGESGRPRTGGRGGAGGGRSGSGAPRGSGGGRGGGRRGG